VCRVWHKCTSAASVAWFTAHPAAKSAADPGIGCCLHLFRARALPKDRHCMSHSVSRVLGHRVSELARTAYQSKQRVGGPHGLWVFCFVILACSLSRLWRRTFLTVSPPLSARWRHVHGPWVAPYSAPSMGFAFNPPRGINSQQAKPNSPQVELYLQTQ
jgi:hypothetical protein